MKRRLLDWLRCPTCRGTLTLADARTQGDEIESGALRCECGRSYPVRNGIPRFVGSDAYTESFSFEWHVHRRTQVDSANAGTAMAGLSARAFAGRVDFPLEELAGKLVLDVGCGSGRYAEVAAAHGAEVIGVDLSLAVDAARENLRHRPNVHLVQADVFALPFADAVFDLVYSFGVLHHTPDCERAFRQLPRVLRPGGTLAIFVYAAYNKAIVYSSAVWRALTTRLPKRLLYWLSHVAVPLYWLYRIPVVGHVGRAVFVIPMLPHWRWRVLDTFDWYSPRYQSKHTHWEVFRWFESEGFGDVKVLPEEITMLGTKLK